MNKQQLIDKIRDLSGRVLLTEDNPHTNWWEVSYYLSMAELAVETVGDRARRYAVRRYEQWDMSKELLSYQSGLIFPPSHLHGKPLKMWYRQKMRELHGTYSLPDNWISRVGIPAPTIEEVLKWPGL